MKQEGFAHAYQEEDLRANETASPKRKGWGLLIDTGKYHMWLSMSLDKDLIRRAPSSNVKKALPNTIVVPPPDT